LGNGNTFAVVFAISFEFDMINGARRPGKAPAVRVEYVNDGTKSNDVSLTTGWLNEFDRPNNRTYLVLKWPKTRLRRKTVIQGRDVDSVG
jgi:hypothetical protein